MRGAQIQTVSSSAFITDFLCELRKTSLKEFFRATYVCTIQALKSRIESELRICYEPQIGSAPDVSENMC